MLPRKKPRLTLGILQRNITYIDGFPRYGCFVACILTAIQRSLQRTLFAHEIQQWFLRCVELGFILHNSLPQKRNVDWYRCYLANYIAAFNAGMEMFDCSRRASPPSSAKPLNIRIYRWKTPWGYHFTYGSPEDNMHDPAPRLRLLRQAGSRDMHVSGGK